MSKKSEFKTIEDLFGDSAADKVTPTLFVDTGIPQLNSILTGDPTKGLPSGQITEIVGAPGSGKTMLASRLMINTQRMGGVALFYDFERAYHLHLSVKQGLDPSKRNFFYAKAKCMETALEDCVRKCESIRKNNLIAETAPITVIFDSYAHMVPKSMLLNKDKKEKALDEYNMKDSLALAAATALTMKAFVPEMNDYNVCAVFLNQVRSNVDGNGGLKSAGGNSLTHTVSTRINITGNDLWTDVAPKYRYGKQMTFETIKNRTRHPFEKTQADFIFNPEGKEHSDFNVIKHYIAYLKNIDVLAKGTWFTFEGTKYQGINNLVEELESDPNGIQRLIKAQQDFIEAGNIVVPLMDEELAKEWEEKPELKEEV